ncbi:MAG: hypothetical protein V4568_18070 [Pseudomonadota bacterium]
MSVPANILQQVQTYQLSGLAFMQNLNCFIGTANTKFKDFERLTANLGDTVTFDLPPRMTTTNSLVANFQPADQRVQSLTVNNQQSVSYEFTAQQFIFNVKDYMARFGKAAIIELGAKIEANVALNCVTNTYRFYGDGVTPISSYGQLAEALAFFRNYGSIQSDVKGYLSDIAVPSIVNSGLNQFAMERNNKIANSWELGMFSKCEWYQSNLLPIHTSGNVGINQTLLTVLSTTLDANGAVTAITFSGAGTSDASAVLQYDKFQFQDGVSGHPNLRYLTFVGHQVSANPVQFAATANAGADGSGHVTVTITPALQVNSVNTQNINAPIVAGMTVKALPSHRAGLISSGNPLFLAMPQLPDQTPFPTGNAFDSETGVSLRQYYGVQFAANAMGMVHDCIWGSTLVPENSMAVIFPL